jgi:hypothetical protein
MFFAKFIMLLVIEEDSSMVAARSSQCSEETRELARRTQDRMNCVMVIARGSSKGTCPTSARKTSTFADDEFQPMMAELKKEYRYNHHSLPFLDVLDEMYKMRFDPSVDNVFALKNAYEECGNKYSSPKGKYMMLMKRIIYKRRRESSFDGSYKNPELTETLATMVDTWYDYPLVSRIGRKGLRQEKAEIEEITAKLMHGELIFFMEQLLNNKALASVKARLIEKHGHQLKNTYGCMSRTKRYNSPEDWLRRTDYLHRSSRFMQEDDEFDTKFRVRMDDCDNNASSVRQRCTKGQRYKAELNRLFHHNFRNYNRYVSGLLRGSVCGNN